MKKDIIFIIIKKPYIIFNFIINPYQSKGDEKNNLRFWKQLDLIMIIIKFEFNIWND